MNTFQMPVTKIDSVTAGTSKPHESVMAYVAPTPTAPPNGTTFDTALPERFTTSACGWLSPGSAAVNTPV